LLWILSRHNLESFSRIEILTTQLLAPSAGICEANDWDACLVGHQHFVKGTRPSTNTDDDIAAQYEREFPTTSTLEARSDQGARLLSKNSLSAAVGDSDSSATGSQSRSTGYCR